MAFICSPNWRWLRISVFLFHRESNGKDPARQHGNWGFTGFMVVTVTVGCSQLVVSFLVVRPSQP